LTTTVKLAGEGGGEVLQEVEVEKRVDDFFQVKISFIYLIYSR
jgi:hypothetical protein